MQANRSIAGFHRRARRHAALANTLTGAGLRAQRVGDLTTATAYRQLARSHRDRIAATSGLLRTALTGWLAGDAVDVEHLPAVAHAVGQHRHVEVLVPVIVSGPSEGQVDALGLRDALIAHGVLDADAEHVRVDHLDLGHLIVADDDTGRALAIVRLPIGAGA